MCWVRMYSCVRVCVCVYFLFLPLCFTRFPCFCFFYLFCEQRVGGAVFVDVGSSLDIVNEVTFLGNSIQIEYDLGIWVRGWRRLLAVV